MPTKKRKYNARFPAGRIKKIMQTDEEVGKVAQAVPIIISRTLELFVESLLNKALQVTVNRNAKTLSPSHVKQCILAEAKFDFLRDLVKNIPDVSAAEEKELQMSAESSPNCSRFSEQPIPPRKIVREDSNSSSSSDIRLSQITLPRTLSSDKDKVRCETITSASAGAIDLTVKTEDHRPIRTANFYHETLPEDPPQSVIKINPSYSSPQPSTSSYTTLTSIEVPRIKIPMPKPETGFFVKNSHSKTPTTPITPIINIDFTKNLGKPEIKVLDNVAAGIVGVKNERTQKLQRQNSKNFKEKKVEVKTPPILSSPVDIDRINYSNLEIDEDYDT